MEHLQSSEGVINLFTIKRRKLVTGCSGSEPD